MNEYISKNKADWLFQEIFCDEEYCGGSCYKCGKEAQYRNKLLQEPAADVQPVKRGRWIITDDVEHFIAICSECGRTEDSRAIKDMPYCHCGARMIKDGEQNENN